VGLPHVRNIENFIKRASKHDGHKVHICSNKLIDEGEIKE